MSSLSNFSKNFTPKKNEEKASQTQSGTEQNQTDYLKQNAEQKYKQYSQMSQSEMMSELFKETNRLKQNGQFNYDALASAIDNLSGVISEEQKELLKALLKQLR